MGEVARVCAWQFIRGYSARDGFLWGLKGAGGKKYRVRARSLARGLLAAHKGKQVYDASECVLRRGKMVRL